MFGRRISKTIDWDGTGGGSAEEVHYVYDGDDILLAFDGDGDLTNRYLHGPAVDQILADEQVTSLTSAGDVLWPLVDNLGSVRDIVDSTGAVENHITYDSFGNVTSETDDTVDHIYAYTGRDRDEESDLQYNRARYYDATVGRWISEDPIGFAAGDSNLARYVGNAATNARDPSGLVATESVSQEELVEPNIAFLQIPDSKHDRFSSAMLSLIRGALDRIQDRLDFLQDVLGKLIEAGDKHAPDAKEWKVLRDAFQHARKYDRAGRDVVTHSGSSYNSPGVPIVLDVESFYGHDPSVAVMIMVHETMHELDREGLGHDRKGPNGRSINDIIGPYSDENMYQRFIDHLKRKKLPSGRSVWNDILDRAKKGQR